MKPSAISKTLGYSADDTSAVPDGANLGLGCGNPHLAAVLKAGETVLDLGSGAGLDVFIAARAVGPQGRVIGVDMTPEMIMRARVNQYKGDFPNVEFRLGEMENLPIADASVDVVISNCAVNLSPDKPRVLREAFRVLKSGGRLAISDMVSIAPLPDALRNDWELHTGCVAGAASVEGLKAMLEATGFAQVRIAPKAESREILSQWFPDTNVENFVASASVEAVKP